MDADPLKEALACVARLRAAIAAERAALARLDLERLEELADQRRGLDAARHELMASLGDAPALANPRMDWARRQLLADMEALRRLARRDAGRPPSVELSALATALEDATPGAEGTVVPLVRPA